MARHVRDETMHADKFDVATDDPERMRFFTQAVLRDLLALEEMVEAGMIEQGVRRIGAEQELFLVDEAGRPSFRAMEVLERLGGGKFTTELGRFNLEANLDPLDFHGDCLHQLEQGLDDVMASVRREAAAVGARPILTGILPTLRQTDLDLDGMAPIARYQALNEAITGRRGSEFELHLRGIDELNVKHDSVMLESCNTSCQFHFQVSPGEFARMYNMAQVATAPVLAAAANSPLLFGKRLWRETRIAVFEQAIDTRRIARHVQERAGRVSFGKQWVKDSILEIYRDDIARFRAFFGMVPDEDPFAELAAGRIPRLKALGLHNGTVYRWNRPCYGVSGGRAHLRIENRVVPSGPTVLDEVANAAFWFGLVSGLLGRYEDVTELMDFDVAKANFVAAARLGLDAHVEWLDGRRHAVDRLILDELLPCAQEGLIGSGLDEADVDRYLGIVERRVSTRRTGAEWQLRSLVAMRGQGTQFGRLRALVEAMAEREPKKPGHEWSLAKISDAGDPRHNYERIGHFMTTDLFTVHVDEVIDLVANVMAWRRVRHVPVEDDAHRLVGLVSSRTLLKVFSKQLAHAAPCPVPVSEVMESDPVCVTPDTLTTDAITLMRDRGVACLPVVKDERLVGIVSEHDFLEIAARLLRGEDEPE